jgi:hypothetical protein
VVAYGSPSPRPERCIVLEKYQVIYKRRIGGWRSREKMSSGRVSDCHNIFFG